MLCLFRSTFLVDGGPKYRRILNLFLRSRNEQMEHDRERPEKVAAVTVLGRRTSRSSQQREAWVVAFVGHHEARLYDAGTGLFSDRYGLRGNIGMGRTLIDANGYTGSRPCHDVDRFSLPVHFV